jgi:hypothetical protein
MSNIKISELDQAGALTGFELLPVVQDNLTVRTNLQQVKEFAGIIISNNIIGDAASTTIAPSVNAIKSYTDGLLVGLLNDRGNYIPDFAPPGAYPSSGGSGEFGAIRKGDIWFINDIGYLGLTPVVIGASVRALVNDPSPTEDSNWDILDASFIQASLESVLTAGNSADNIITLTNGSQTSTLSKDSLRLDTSTTVNAATYNAYTFQISNIAGQYLRGSVDALKVYNATYNNSTELKFDSLNYNNFGFIGKLSTNVLTSSQLWSFPNASGTIALAENVWNALGNAGTIAGANFLGTTDAVDLVIKTNSLERIRVAKTGGVIISDLVGTGTRTVVASPTGQLSTTISSSGWSTLGNASTSDLTNFIGTTDNVDLVFRTDNVEQLRLKSTGGSGNIETPFDIYSQNNTGGSVISAKSTGSNGFASISWDNTNKGILSLGNGIVKGTIKVTNLATADKEYQLPNASGIIALTDTVTLQNVLAGTNKNLTNGINLQGTDAGTGNTATVNINAFGAAAATNNSGNNLNAFGANAAYGNTQGNVNAIGSNAGFSNTGASVNAMGSNAANGNTGFNVNAFGASAAQGNTNSQVNAIGQQAAYQNNGLNVNAIGYLVAYQNYGQAVNAIGYAAAKNNLGSDTNALGTNAALNNEGQYTNAIGNQAAVSNTGIHVNGIGQFAAYNNQGTFINALGLNAGNGNGGDNVNAFGNEAAMNNGSAATYVNAFGYQAAKGNIGGYVNAIGVAAAQDNTGSNVNALGINAAKGSTQGNLNALGFYSGYQNTGFNVNTMGESSAYQNSGGNVNAFGASAGQNNTGDNVNAIGAAAAEYNTGSNVNAFGVQAGLSNTISGVTIFSNSSLPSYANHAAAAVAITVLLGGSAGCTYLYHNQATNSIGAVRL